jgi:deoxyribose-phosphate aldolase
MRPEDLAKTLDHLVLDPAAGPDDVDRACDDAMGLHVASLCTLPAHVSRVAARLRGSDVQTCAVIGWPDGAAPTAAKVAAAEEAVSDGAGEIEVVMNVAALSAGEFTAVRDELARVMRALRSRAVNSSRGGALVKVVIEAPLLDEKLTRLACKIVELTGADFATTCTGTRGAAAATDVEIMRDALPEHVGVKAAGGVRTLEDVQTLISAGGARVGTDAAPDVIGELLALNGQ